MEPAARKKVNSDTKKTIGGAVATVVIDPKFKKGKGESGVEVFWHKNRYFHQISQPWKDVLFAWNATADGINLIEAYFSKLENIKKNNHNKHVHSRKGESGKGKTSPKRYKFSVASAVKADISKINRKNKIQVNCPIH